MTGLADNLFGQTGFFCVPALALQFGPLDSKTCAENVFMRPIAFG